MEKEFELHIHPLQQEDLPLLAGIQPHDWNDITPIHEFYLKSPLCHPVKIMHDDKLVGIGTSIIHHDIAWLANVIVHPEYRNQGIGRLVTQTLINSINSKTCDTIYLIATDLGAPVYQKLGFETETHYLFFKDLKANSAWVISENIIPTGNNFNEQIARINQQVSGEQRMFHLEPHLANGYVYINNKIVEGFYLPTFGEGLILAITDVAGIELMKLRLQTKDNASFPADNKTATELLHSQGYQSFRTMRRMRLGNKKSWQAANIYNRIGGNFG